jgi:hypothetical protein
MRIANLYEDVVSGRREYVRFRGVWSPGAAIGKMRASCIHGGTSAIVPARAL